MNENAITKTLLTIWPGLTDYEAMLAERAHNHALCSCNTPLLTNRIIDKIIDLNVKQQTIHGLNMRLNRVIEKLPTDTQAVLRSYYRTFGNATNISAQAKQLGIAERTPNFRASYEHVDTTPRSCGPDPTMTGFPRHSGWSRCSTAAKNASISTWRTVMGLNYTLFPQKLRRCLYRIERSGIQGSPFTHTGKVLREYMRIR